MRECSWEDLEKFDNSSTEDEVDLENKFCFDYDENLSVGGVGQIVGLNLRSFSIQVHRCQNDCEPEEEISKLVNMLAVFGFLKNEFIDLGNKNNYQ